MSQTHAFSLSSWNNNANLSLTYETPWLTKIPSPLSVSCTPDSTPALPIKASPSSWEDRQQPKSPQWTKCAVCWRLGCQLRSHRAFLSAKGTRHTYMTYKPGFIGEKPYAAKSKQIDDLTIRTAFTKSYAFVEPSYLSILQPSSFRLDQFHDLPITGGDHPEMHRSIWAFLAYQLHHLSDVHMHSKTTIDELQRTCLVSALTDPTACLCILATERILRARAPEQIHDEHAMTLINASEKYLKWLKYQLSNRDGVDHTLNKVILLCLRLVQTPGSTPQHFPDQSVLSSWPDEWTQFQPDENSVGNLKSLTFDDVIACEDSSS